MTIRYSHHQQDLHGGPKNDYQMIQLLGTILYPSRFLLFKGFWGICYEFSSVDGLYSYNYGKIGGKVIQLWIIEGYGCYELNKYHFFVTSHIYFLPDTGRSGTLGLSPPFLLILMAYDDLFILGAGDST